MVAPATGAVVLVRFPFSDLSRSKLRPASYSPMSGAATAYCAKSPASRTAIHRR